MNKDIGILVCVHGNEQYGLKIKEILNNKFEFIVANPLAVEKNVRFVDANLNRVFPGNKNSNLYEEKRAFELAKEIDNFSKLIDLHSTSEKMDLTGIISYPFDKEKMDFVKSLKLKKLVLMPESFDEGTSTDKYHNCCVCIEIGPHDGKNISLEVINLLENIGENISYFDGEVFEIFKVISKEKNCISYVKNYKFVKKGDPIMQNLDGEIICADFDFYPVLANEISYDEILCFATKKIEFDSIN